MLHRTRSANDRRRYLIAFGLLSFLSVICLAFGVAERNGADVLKREILLRRMGHQLLLQAGDDTSRVLPIQKISSNQYQFSFESALAFEPASLINISRGVLNGEPVASELVVNVLNGDDHRVVYGYAISKDKEQDIVTCIGRKQPKARYMINVTFGPASKGRLNNGYLLGGLPVLAFVGFIFLRSPRSPKPKAEVLRDEESLSIGGLRFDPKGRKLIVSDTAIDLTGTETRLLHIFARSPNITIERARLQKEIWEDEGVIVGRSLDMFISKLRKKLECDPNIKLVVVRGKGYRLEVDAH
ncbi:winged helix-turn-helix domain-containing protein [Mucilaginibacter daejeonensis]|uniref:winged helix-turn-helix domain-containing protein n=1 Tax=Mucilaginibacter daejeonensis TaxID=398049 RepID=UPI001D17871E|nr:winged helix-turn-helix domain-containing protein [Mucilaginibacter daejeonensis]UEG54277.1 winged helix-turn-helix domain-containing protein [Mucilaginibacter daejeonensis]